MKRLVRSISCGALCKKTTRQMNITTDKVYRQIVTQLIDPILLSHHTHEYINTIKLFFKKAGCVVHHINYDRSNNSLSNLALVYPDVHDDIHLKSNIQYHMNSNELFKQRYNECIHIEDEDIREEMLFKLECDIVADMGKHLKSLQRIIDDNDGNKLKTERELYNGLVSCLNRSWR